MLISLYPSNAAKVKDYPNEGTPMAYQERKLGNRT